MLRRLVPAALLLTLVAAGPAACGGSGGDDPNEVLKDTFSGDKEVRSGRLSLGLRLQARGAPQLQGPVNLRLSGPFQTQGDKKLPKFALTFSLNGAGQSFSAAAITTGDKGYVRAQQRTFELPAELFQTFKRSYEQSQGRRPANQTTLQSLGIDPINWLEDPEEEGTEEVGGADTVHISSKVNVRAFLDDIDQILQKAPAAATGGRVPRRLTPEQRRQAEEAIEDATFDVWTGEDDKILRKLEVKLRFVVPEDRRREANGLESGDVALTVELGEVNEDQTIEAPANARPLEDIEDLGIFGGAGGSGSSGSDDSGQGEDGGAGGGTTGGTTGAPSGEGGEQLDEYARCLDRAGQDIAEAQKCADVLEP